MRIEDKVIVITGGASGLGLATARFMVKAYHGTPHTFEPEPGAPLGRFKKEKIGTGEGAAAYGWGVAYTAESRGVAESYKPGRESWQDRVQIDGKPMAYALFGLIPHVDGILETTPNLDNIYEVQLPKSVNGTIFRIIFGPTPGSPFYRFDCQIKVAESGMETDSTWVPVK